MRYMYTTAPDEGCHEVESGIYGRPVQTSDEPKLRAEGWTLTINAQRGTDHVRQGQEERQEGQEVTKEHMKSVKSALRKQYVENVGQAIDAKSLALEYEDKFGKKPHHKMKPETIRQKLEESDD